MSEVSLRLNLPPAAQYHSGHSLIVQGETIQEVKEVLAEEVGEDRATFIIATFFENVLLGGVKDVFEVPHEEAEQTALERAKELAAAKRKGAK